jgi:signal transduction histidine kinase
VSAAAAGRAVVVAFSAAFAVLVALAAVQAATGPAARGLLLACLGVWAVAYAVLAVPAFADQSGWRPVAFRAVHVAVVGVLAWEQPSLLFVMFLAYPLVWFVVGSIRAGVVWTLLLAAAALLGPTIAWAHGDEPLWGPGETLVGAVLSLMLGLWITRSLELSAQRAALIEQLEQTRAALAVAHHEAGVVAERERLAREVHDTLAQGYTSIVVLAQTAAAQLGTDPAAARERLSLIEEVAR